MIRVIDNQKIDITNDEWQVYQDICRAYDRPNCKGEELFKELFITDENGIIVFIKPPSVRQTSMEVFLFVCAIFQHQHIRLMEYKVDRICAKVDEKLKILSDKLEKKE
jgi:hypothetical protein